MARINGISYPGITVEKDLKGNVSSVRINLKRCGDDVKDYLKSIGIIRPTGKELTMKALEELENGGGTEYDSFEDYKAAMSESFSPLIAV